MASSIIPLPPPLKISGNVSNNWRVFNSMWKNYETATNLIEKSSEIRTATLLSCIGMDGFELYETLDFAEEGDRKQIDKVLERLEMHFVGEVNETFERFKFNQRNQEVSEGIDGYVSSLRSLVKTCNFAALEDSLLRDRVVMGIHEDSTRKKTIRKLETWILS